MRRFIYKAEIDLLIREYKIDTDEKIVSRIKSKLFKNPTTTPGKQYQLKDKIDSLEKIELILDDVNVDEFFIGAVKDIFEINEDLKIDERLRSLILGNEKVAVFIGAGVSKLLGYPLWGELSDWAIDELWRKDKISFAESERLYSEVRDPKQALSIFDKFCSRKNEDGQKFYSDIFDSDKSKEENPFKYIVSPFFDWLKVTSNIDFSLANAQNDIFNKKKKKSNSSIESSNPTEKLSKKEFRDKYIVSNNFPESSIDHDKIYYLHGRVDDVGNSIFTTEDYIKYYFSEKSNVRKFLEVLFQEYNVLFIGYGLAELPILEAVMRKSEKKHFALVETKYHEKNVFQIKERYYKQLEINPIPYYIDHDGYDRLITVLKSWEKEIKREREKAASSYLEERNLIDEVL